VPIFYPDKDLVYLELVVEKGKGRILGIQGLGSMSHSMFARVGAVAAILKYRPTTADISNLELLYAPPFSSAMDILNALGNTAENTLQGKNRVIDADQFVDWWFLIDKSNKLIVQGYAHNPGDARNNKSLVESARSLGRQMAMKLQ